jgi:competence ComEA-like helix-hairpin-helix protein
MPQSAGTENRSDDYRWLLLVLVALLIAAYAPLSQFLAGKGARWGCGEKAPGLAWTPHEWYWSNNGSQGEGFYRKPRLKGANDSAAARLASVDPHLAIFTYQPIDLNRADAAVLQSIKGIGPKLAGAIVGYRLSKGLFRSLDDLLLVKGVGPAKLANLRSQLIVVEGRLGD